MAYGPGMRSRVLALTCVAAIAAGVVALPQQASARLQLAPSPATRIVAGSAATAAQPTPAVHWDTCLSYVPERARCGHVRVLADPLRPELGKQRVGFELYPRRNPTGPSDGVLVAQEGGPGYPTTESRRYYLNLWGPLLANRRALFVDERGTGASDAIGCKGLQRGTLPYEDAVAKCGAKLGERADTYGTAYGADDMATVLDALGITKKIDLYGDSYGTYFAQTFAVRHPDRVRTVVLDASYTISDWDPWYTDINRAIVDAVGRVCDRDPDCVALGGDPVDRLRSLATDLHANPVKRKAYDSEGNRRTVTMSGANLAATVAYATYGTTIYRELDAAVRAYEAGNRKPLARMIAENVTTDPDNGSPYYFSYGEYIAVICNDIPALWDVSLPPGPQREAEYADSLADLKASDSKPFDPFLTHDWLKTSWSEPRTCIKWPAPTDQVLPEPPGAVYPDVPTLVLSGDLDTITSPEGGLEVAARFPNSTFLSTPNVGHVVALGDRQGCAEGIVRRYVESGGTVSGEACLGTAYPPVRTVPEFVRTMAELEPAKQGATVTSSTGDRRAVSAALFAAADLWARWYANYSGDGVGLYGGTFTYSGSDVVRWTVKDYAFVKDLVVDGTVTWDRDTGKVVAKLTVDGPGGRDGRLKARWDDDAQDARATVRGQIHDRAVRLTTSAP